MNSQIDNTLEYLRYTHKNGVFRQECSNIWDKLGIVTDVIHNLSPTKWMTLYDIMASIYEYASQYPFENGLGEFGNPIITQEYLKILTSFDMVKTRKRSKL